MPQWVILETYTLVSFARFLKPIIHLGHYIPFQEGQYQVEDSKAIVRGEIRPFQRSRDMHVFAQCLNDMILSRYKYYFCVEFLDGGKWKKHFVSHHVVGYY